VTPCGEILTEIAGVFAWRTLSISVDATYELSPWIYMTITEGVPSFWSAFRLRLNASYVFDGNTATAGDPLPFIGYDSRASVSEPNSFNLTVPMEFQGAQVICRGESFDGGVANSDLSVSSAVLSVGTWRGNVTPL
jgi:hypothetical protein